MQQQPPLTPVLETEYLDTSPFLLTNTINNSYDYLMSTREREGREAELVAQDQLSARPSPRLHPSASMPNIWRGDSTSPHSARQTPTRLKILPDDTNNGNTLATVGLGFGTPARTNEARAPGQPLTPPMSPNGPTSHQSQGSSPVQSTDRSSPRSEQQQSTHSSFSSFRANAPRFEPFGSNFMLPSPARTVRRDDGLQSNAEQDEQNTDADPFRVQFPRTEQTGPRTDVSQESNVGDAGAALTSSFRQRMRLNSPVNILDQEYVTQRGGRLLLVSNVPCDVTEDELKTAFAVLGDLRGLYIRFWNPYGVVILSFFDMRTAAEAHRYYIRTHRFFRGVTLQSQFISATALNRMLGSPGLVNPSEGEVYISTMGEGNLNQIALQNVLATYGSLRTFRVIGTHGKAFFAEFSDTRDADSAVIELNKRQVHNITLRLTHGQPPSMLDLTPLTVDPASTIADLQRQQDEIALFQHYRQIVELKQREEEQASLLALKAPEGDDIARGGPFDPTMGTLGRRGSFPGSSPRIDEREERFASLTDGSTIFGASAAGHAEFERERKGSNIYGPDHIKAIIPSYPSPRTPTRNVIQQLADLPTPKKRPTLPPYSGPLPPPDAMGSTAWPRPLRIPSPTLSSPYGTNSAPASGIDSAEFFIPTQTPPRRLNRGNQGTSGQSVHTFLPSSARIVLDVLREPPPERNKIDLKRIREGHDTRTTVMLKNVPNKMTDKHLMAFIDSVTPKSYSFLYLRMDFENHCNVGYAFVNFIDVDSLLKFAEAKLGQKWGMFNSEKVLHMSYANYQGKEALVEKFRNSGVMEEREAWRPKIFYSSGPMQGEPEPFPPPNNHLRQQRSFQNGRTQGLYNANAPSSSSYGLNRF